MKGFFSDIYSAFIREFKLIKSDAGLLIFLLLLPLAYPIVYSLIYNPEIVRDVAVVVVDNDRSPMSREVTRRIDATQGANIIGYAANLQEARKAINEHKAYGILEIPEGFGEKIGRGEQAPAVMYCEMSLLLRYKALLVSTTDIMQAMGSELLTEKIDDIAPLAETISTGDLMPIENVPMGNIESGFDSFVMPGILILILQQAMMLAIGMSGGAKRENPMRIDFENKSGRVSVMASMIGQTACLLIIMLVPTIYVIHYVPLMFKFPMEGSVWQELLFILPMLLSTIGMGFVFQGIVRERESVFVIWVVTSLIFLFLSGLTWPRYAMQSFWKFLSDCVPATWGVEGFIKMNTNGSSLAQVRGCYINLWILTAVYWTLGWIVQRFVQTPAIKKAWKRASVENNLEV